MFDTEDSLLAGLSGFQVTEAGVGWTITATVAGEDALATFSLSTAGLLTSGLSVERGQHEGLSGLVSLDDGTAIAMTRQGDDLIRIGLDSLTTDVMVASSVTGGRIEALDAATTGGETVIAWANIGSEGFSVATLDATGAATDVVAVADDDALPIDDVRALAIHDTGTETLVFAGGGRDSGLAVFRLDEGGAPVAVEHHLPGGDFGHYQVSALEIVETPDQDYLVVGASASSSLTVFAIGADGTLSITDHIFDNMMTRFGGVDTIASATIDGVTLIAAGGADRGATIFALDQEGTLNEIATVEDSAEVALHDVSGLELLAGETAGEALLVTAGQADSGLSVVKLDLDTLGADEFRFNEGPQMDTPVLVAEEVLMLELPEARLALSQDLTPHHVDEPVAEFVDADAFLL
ncbi:hypothetical protein [Pontivivens ytuae]|uniref:Uncharacterized protein n=1 Tax=Pontivivens ytuae TaxID=2789856 RepID=A0A7S9QF69_9RHOB|nr:hypothetical protein [Pontivivens ytuae]QPH55941.1 hypothetical protein I0K15_09525 [Pontivivens ytuae]